MKPQMQVKRGISRTVLLVGRWAIKVPTTRPYGRRSDRLWAWTRGYQANYSELQWAGVAGVAPVRWHIGAVLVCFARAQPLPAPHPDPDDPWWRTIAPDVPFADPKPQNVGILDGKAVWLDYDGSWNGCPHTRSVDASADNRYTTSGPIG